MIKLAAFAATLALLLAGGYALGNALDPSAPRTQKADAMTAMDGESGHGAMAADPVRGLSVAQGGLRLVVPRSDFTRGETGQLRFRIVDDKGATVRDFDVEHTKRMHLIVVRRDMTGFQHLHPRQDKDGEWSTPLRLDAAGSYRVFADFSHDDKATTLASDLRVDGPASLVPLPKPAHNSVSDSGYSVRMDESDVRAGEETKIRFTVLKDGKPVHVEPYLGANGHLVALREGDMAFLHVHPMEGTTEFESTFPTVGQYRLFLQFKHEGRVHTAAFTQEVI